MSRRGRGKKRTLKRVTLANQQVMLKHVIIADDRQLREGPIDRSAVRKDADVPA